MSELKNKIEALLFASGKGLSIEEISEYCKEKNIIIKKTLNLLHEKFNQIEGSLIVDEHNKKWKMTVRGKYTDLIKKIVSETELPGPILKTLAVIAYKSPVLQSEIIHMRGQSAYDHIKQLNKQKFITKDEKGRSYILKITDKFFNYFDVEGDAEIREIFSSLKEKDLEQRKKIEKEHEDHVQKKLGNLAIVESTDKKDHEKIFDDTTISPVTKQKTEKEIKEEKSFLSNIDSKIDEISKRLDKHQIPKRQEEIDKENENTKEEEESYL